MNDLPRRRRIGVILAVGVVLLFLAWPRDDFLDPGRPDLEEDDFAPGAVPASLVAAPVQVPLASLTDMLEESVPNSFGDLDQRHELEDRDRTAMSFHLRRGPFQVSLEGDRATLTTTIRYGMKLYYDPPVLPELTTSCGLDEDGDPPRLSVSLETPISVDRSWRLRTRAEMATIEPPSRADRDRCTVTFLDIDLTDRVVEAAASFLRGHLDDIDSIAAEVDVRSSFEGWWRTLQEPIRLTDSLWMAMKPEAVRAGGVRGSSDFLEVALAMQARPTLFYGPRPDLPDRDLPPLDTGSVENGLDLRVEARVEYAAASAFVAEELGGRRFEHAGRVFTLDSLRVFGVGGGRLAVEVLLSGDVAARLFLVGVPKIDPTTGRISVPDLDFDVSTRDMVLAAASWIHADELREVLREQARWPAAPAIEFLEGWLVKGLNRDLSDDLRVEGQVASLRILGVHALREVLLVQVAAQGSARLFVIHGEGR